MHNTIDNGRDDDLIDLRVIFRLLFARRWLVLGSIVLSVAAFAIYAFLATPFYRATVVMVPAAQDRGQGSLSATLDQLGGLASLAGINVGSTGIETEEALAVLKSREFSENFINDHNLVRRFFPSKWDATKGVWKVHPEQRPTPAKAFRYFDRVVRSVSQDKKTSLVSLQIEWSDRLEAANWANDLVARLNAEMRKRAIARADANVGFLSKELETVSVVETREAISRLMESQIKQRMLANVTREYALRVIDKALPVDADDPVRPKKLVLVIIGFLLGCAVGVSAALVAGRGSTSDG
jgi:uncharacterized protein involved in exopolysaccharide biosynthesis